MIILFGQAGHHNGEAKKYAPRKHDDPRAKSVKQAADEPALEDGTTRERNAYYRLRERRPYREKEHPKRDGPNPRDGGCRKIAKLVVGVIRLEGPKRTHLTEATE